MEVTLTVVERLVLMNLLPKESNFTTLKLVRKARENLSFDDLENKRLGFIQDGDQVRWNESEKIVKKIEFGDTVGDQIIDTLKKLNEGGKLKDEQFTLYEKFVELEGERVKAQLSR